MSVARRRPGILPRARRISAALVVTSLFLGGPLASATLAVPGLEVSTPFPAVAVEPGGTANFDIVIGVTQDRRVDLSVTGAPSGWTTEFRGGGLIVDGAFITVEEPPEITLSVEVPEDATAGASRLTVRAASGALSETLVLDVRVSEAAAGSVSLTTDFAELSGASTDQFTFNLELDNDTPGTITFGLGVTGPAGWEVDINPSGQDRATTVTVDAGSTQRLTVAADPPDDAAAAPYPITVEVSGGGQTATTELSVTITGTFTMNVSTPNQVLSTTANAGTEKELQLTIENRGTAPLTNVTITASTPSGWTFTGADVPVIQPGDAPVTVTVKFKPSNNAVSGDYDVTVTATAAEATDTAGFRITVETPPLWGLVGIALLALVGGALYWVFRTYGRR